MANDTLKIGATGSSVSRWQKYLKDQGYDLEVDGIFGSVTDKLTKAWQKAKNLVADGIVGVKSWTEANKSNNTAGSSNEWKYDDFSYDDFSYGDYVESDTVKNAGDALNSHVANKPAAYESQWQTKIDELMNSITNREKFSYDFNADAIYQQYKDKYIQQGKLAMADTMGQAAAMTGGYGNSYAQSVGQQAYQAHLNNLNDIIPELYQMALDKYNQEGQELYNQYGMLSDRENLDYGRYRDDVSDYLTERDYLAGRYDSERDYDYSKYNNERGFAYDEYSSDRSLAYDQYATDKDLSYQEYRNAIADEHWQKEFDEAVRQHNENFAFQKKQYEDSKVSSGKTTNKPSNTTPSTKEPEEDGGYKAVNTQGITDFKAAIRTRHEFGRSENPDKIKYKTYNAYVEGMLDKWLTEGRLTEDEVATLIAYYGLS